MSFKPCLIIPVYNHHLKLNVVAEGLRAYQVPCLIIDDGSSEECKTALETLDQQEDWINLVRFEQNRGKGAAVCAGLRIAHEQGFSHALQVDSDGQHDLKDIPKFIAAAKRQPQALIAGSRPYAAMPKNRRYGRFLTDALVWINTLSLQIKDSMCGYRLYPLRQTVELLNDAHIGQRMDFDTDIMVRLYWKGIELCQIDTAVVYQTDIISHFDLIGDNIRISKMHAMHFLGMLKRSPYLLNRTLKRTFSHAKP